MIYSSLRTEKTRGFIGVVFLAIALIAIVTASIAVMNRSSNKPDVESRKVSAATVMKHAADYKSIVEKLQVEGRSIVEIANILSGYTTGYENIVPKHIPPALISAPETYLSPRPTYYFGSRIAIPGIGRNYNDNEGYELVVTLLISSREACQQINNLLHRDALTAAPATSGNVSLNWSGLGVTDADNATAQSNYRGRHENCVRTSPVAGPWVYYKTLIEN